MMTNNPELMDFILRNEGETFKTKEANIASTLQNLMGVTPATRPERIRNTKTKQI